MFAANCSAMSIVGTNLDVRQALMSAARLGGLGLVVDESVKGTITINLKDISPAEAIYFIADVKGLSVEERNGNYLVSAAKSGLSKSVYSYNLQYADAAEVLKIIDDTLGYFDLGRGAKSDGDKTARTLDNRRFEQSVRATADAATNTVIFYGTPQQAAAIRNLIEKVDIPAKQVSIEAKVVAVDKNAAKNLGVEWNWSTLPQYPKRETTYESRYRTAENADGSYTTLREDVPKTTVTRSYNDGNVGGIIQFGRGPEGYPFEFYYEAKINALITDGKAKMLSKPNITALQGKEAVITIGGEIPVPKTVATNTSATSSVEYKKVGIILRCTPRVNEDGYITSRVHTEVSSPIYVDEMRAYRIQNRSAETTVRLKDGETMVIGGLIGAEESRRLSKVPFLGDLPVLGVFFRNLRKEKADSEIMIFLTARVLK